MFRRLLGSHASIWRLTAEECLRRSDIAMYAAKRAGRNCHVWFDEKMERELLASHAVGRRDSRCCRGRRVRPLLSTPDRSSTGQLTGFEVLARWRSPVKGLLEPAEFMDIAEASGLISELSLSVMGQALREARDWPGHLKIAVNISPIQFRDSKLAERILKLLVETNFPASALRLRFRESSFLEDRDPHLRSSKASKTWVLPFRSMILAPDTRPCRNSVAPFRPHQDRQELCYIAVLRFAERRYRQHHPFPWSCAEAADHGRRDRR